MRQRRVSEYFSFGLRCERIFCAKNGDIIAEHKENYEHLIKFLETNGFGVARNICESELGRFFKKTTTEKLKESDCEEIRNGIRTLAKTVVAEMDNYLIFSLSEKRLGTKKLYAQVPSLLADDVFGKLPKIAQHDLTEAGKCVVFERHTATAFHISRCIEAVLRHYYHSYDKAGTQKLWGNIIGDLRKLLKPPPKSLLDHLDNIRANYRNPTQHPDAMYSENEAQDLLHVAIEVINRMVGDKKWKKVKEK